MMAELAGGSTPSGQADSASLSCPAGASASDDCEVLAIVNSVQSYWSQQLARSGTTYTPANTVFFSGSTPTGCGTGETGMGPFYCPADGKVYIDLTFWSELKTQFGANDAPFTQAYVLAHEYGHHVQDLLGTNSRVSAATGASSGSVRLELQADCYAGVWANHASTVAGSDGQILISDITEADVDNALDTAGKIGDDYIQTHLGSGRVDTSQFTHGSSAQRKKWFSTGYSTGNPAVLQHLRHERSGLSSDDLTATAARDPPVARTARPTARWRHRWPAPRPGRADPGSDGGRSPR